MNMQLELMTKQMAEDFKNDVLEEIRKVFLAKSTEETWLKGHEVRKFLDCSEGTLVNLRVSGKLPYAKIQGSIYYRKSDLLNMLNSSLIA
jgi:hypothetical protein